VASGTICRRKPRGPLPKLSLTSISMAIKPPQSSTSESPR
jgi:hypothetical protein